MDLRAMKSLLKYKIQVIEDKERRIEELESALNKEKLKLKLTLYSQCISRICYFSPNQDYARLNVVLKEGLVLRDWAGQR